MKKSLISTTALTLVALALVAVMFVLNSGVFAVHANTNGGTVIHVVEHAITDTVGDVPPKGDSLGDQLAFHNPVFDAADKKQVGHDNGNCVRTVMPVASLISPPSLGETKYGMFRSKSAMRSAPCRARTTPSPAEPPRHTTRTRR